MYRCSEVVRLLSSDEYATAGIFKKLQVRLHLLMCRNCSKYARQLRALAAALRQGEEPLTPAEIESAKSRILRSLSEK